MNLLLLICCLVPILTLVIQDALYRRVSIWLMVLCTLSALLHGWYNGLTPENVILNLGFFLFTISALMLHSRIRYKNWFYFIDHSLGLGDLLFFIPLCFSFSFPNLVLFFTLSLIGSLAFFVGLALLRKKTLFNTEFPLISGLGTFYAVTLILHHLGIIHPFDF